MKQKIKYYLFLGLIMLISNPIQAQKESDYSNQIQEILGGQREYAVTSGYVDLLTKTHAIEVEYANKWKQSIGQALWYGQQTLKQPGIILILRKKSDYKYFIQLNTALDYGGLADKIKVWLYPNDFPNVSDIGARRSSQLGIYQTVTKKEKTVPVPRTTSSFWLTKSSGIRHNSGCRYYGSTRGRNCAANEGRACKKCGG